MPGATERDLAGRRILVTGASGHLGGVVAAKLTARGAAVVGIARRGSDTVTSCDITDPEAVGTTVGKIVATLGGLDTVVHCAGIGRPGFVGAPPTADDETILDVNLWGAWRVTAAALPALLEARGRVVFISSLMAYASTPFSGCYAVSKRALGAYADALRTDYGSHLLVTSVYPGHFDTEIHEEGRAVGMSMDDKVPHEELGDVAETVVGVVTAETPPRDLATALVGEVALQIGRRLPGAGADLVDRRVRTMLAQGDLDGIEMADGLRELLLDSESLRQTSTGPAALARGLRTGSRLFTELMNRADGGSDKVGPIWNLIRPLFDGVAGTIESGTLGLADGDLDKVKETGVALAQQLLPTLLTPPANGGPSLLDPRVLAYAALEIQSYVERTAEQIVADGAGKSDTLAD